MKKTLKQGTAVVVISALLLGGMVALPRNAQAAPVPTLSPSGNTPATTAPGITSPPNTTSGPRIIEYDGTNNEEIRNAEGSFAVVVKDGVMSIGDGAFYECSSLTSITLPDSVTDIGDGAFEGCSSLTSITWNGKTYTSVDDFTAAFH